MIKCEVTEYFTLKKFNELENIVRANENNNTKDGELFVEDTFDCTEEMANYLTGDNDDKIVVVKIINGEKTNDDLEDTDEENEGEIQDAKNEENESKEEENGTDASNDEEKSKNKKSSKK